MVTGDRNGFALPAAIGGLVIVGVLVTAGFYMARQEVRIGVASKHAAMAVSIAQTGANEIMANWNGYQVGKIPLGGDSTIVDTLDSGIWSVTVSNLNNRLYLLDARGEVTEGGVMWAGANRRVGIMTRLLLADIDPPAALTTRGSTTLSGGARVYGKDADPPEWDGYCSGILEDKAGITTTDTTSLSKLGKALVSGDPPVQEDPTLSDSTFNNFGDVDWDQMVKLAKADGKDVTSLGSSVATVLPDSIGSLCRMMTLTNWGDPRDPAAACGSYFPLIYHAGPLLTIQSGGFGQGILMVDGTLDVRGDFVFYGVVLVQGTFSTQGSGNRIYGAVMASNALFDSQSLVGGSAVQQSTCAVQRAILNNASLSKLRPLNERSWIDLSGVVN